MEVEEQKSKLEGSRPAYKHTVLVEARPHTDCTDHRLKLHAVLLQLVHTAHSQHSLYTYIRTYIVNREH